MNFCEKCGEKLNEDTLFCGHCGAKVITELKECVEQNLENNNNCPKCGNNVDGGTVIITFIIIGILIFFISVCSMKSTENPEAYKQQDNSVKAYMMCEKFVKDKLKSPSSAVFPDVRDEEKRGAITQVGTDGYMIKSYVESQNSFGAMIKTEYIAILRQVSNNSWECVRLEFFE